jgi:hypothetical protein
MIFFLLASFLAFLDPIPDLVIKLKAGPSLILDPDNTGINGYTLIWQGAGDAGG